LSERIAIDSSFIKLDSFLKLANLAMSGGEAKLAILEGLVSVNSQVENRRGRKLYPGDTVAFAGCMISVCTDKAD